MGSFSENRSAIQNMLESPKITFGGDSICKVERPSAPAPATKKAAAVKSDPDRAWVFDAINQFFDVIVEDEEEEEEDEEDDDMAGHRQDLLSSGGGGGCPGSGALLRSASSSRMRALFSSVLQRSSSSDVSAFKANLGLHLQRRNSNTTTPGAGENAEDSSSDDDDEDFADAVEDTGRYYAVPL